MAVKGAGRAIRQAVTAWEGVGTLDHRFGGTEFCIGRREIGHIHGDFLVDIPFPKRIRDELVGAGMAQAHHVLPASGWVSVPMNAVADVERAIQLLHRSYDLARDQKRKVSRGPVCKAQWRQTESVAS